MKLTIHEMRDDYGLLEFEEVNYSFLNSLRRALLSMVPCLGIHEVDFHMGALGSWTDEEGEEHEYESLSAMFNEVGAAELGEVFTLALTGLVVNIVPGTVVDSDGHIGVEGAVLRQVPRHARQRRILIDIEGNALRVVAVAAWNYRARDGPVILESFDLRFSHSNNLLSKVAKPRRVCHSQPHSVGALSAIGVADNQPR